MDHTEDASPYRQDLYGVNNQRCGGSSQKSKLPSGNSTCARPCGNNYANVEEEDELGEEEEEEDEETEVNGVSTGGKDDSINDDDDDDDDDDEVEETSNPTCIIPNDVQHHQKKQKLKSLISNYELVPCAAAPTNADHSSAKPSTGGRNPLTDWTEHETLVLLDAWGERFLHHGRKSLHSEEWQEVAEKVSQNSKVERTNSQCRNRLDTLKKKYKKEKARLAETKGASSSKWVFFRKMDILMSSSSHQAGLSCGMDSGEYVFMSPKVYLNHANGLDEMRDSPVNSESFRGRKEDSDGLPPRRKGIKRKTMAGASFQLLADSVQKFSEIYEKIESNKRQQMIELEKMRMDFHREIELQRRQILERAQAEIVKIRQDGGNGDDEEDDVSGQNVRG